MPGPLIPFHVHNLGVLVNLAAHSEGIALQDTGDAHGGVQCGQLCRGAEEGRAIVLVFDVGRLEVGGSGCRDYSVRGDVVVGVVGCDEVW